MLNHALQLDAEAVDLKREEEEWAALSKEEQDEKKRLDELAARARAEQQQPQSPTLAHSRTANGRATESGASKHLGRSGSGPSRASVVETPGSANPVSKYAVQRSQGSADQAAMVALSSAALGNLTVRTSVKDKSGALGGSPSRLRAGSVDGIQPGSPWPITASAQKAQVRLCFVDDVSAVSIVCVYEDDCCGCTK